MQIVASASPLGAEMTTRFAPPVRCPAALSRLVKSPVDSITTSTPWSLHGISPGSMTSSFATSHRRCRSRSRSPSPRRQACRPRSRASGGTPSSPRHPSGRSRRRARRPPTASRQQRAGERAADATEAVDAHTNRHTSLLSLSHRIKQIAERLRQSRGIVPVRRGCGDLGAHRPHTARPHRVVVDARPAAPSGGASSTSTRAPCSSTARR